MKRSPLCSRGQSVIELVIGIAIGIALLTGAIAIIAVSLRTGSINRARQPGLELSQELTTQTEAAARASWLAIFNAGAHGTSTPYHLVASGTDYIVASGTESLTVNGISFTRWLTMSDVYRDNNDTITGGGGGTLDPSTLCFTFNTNWTQDGESKTVTLDKCLTRSENRVIVETTWTSGSGQEGPVATPNGLFASSTNINYASTAGAIFISRLQTDTYATSQPNIDATNHWAWNDSVGWIDFLHYNNISVSSTKIYGYASSGVGVVALDCGTSPSASCTYPYGISNDGSGILSGWAWNDIVGWISFASTTPSSSYGVTVDSDGIFHGWAWNDSVGWISFNCDHTADYPATPAPNNISTCGTSSYRVETIWSAVVANANLTSSIFDTGIVGGAAYNTIMWQGSQPTQTSVRFQLATSNNPAGPWSYVGSDGTGTTYYQPAGPNVQTKINRTYHNNERFVRYKVFLQSDPGRTVSPRVDDIIINWSP